MVVACYMDCLVTYCLCADLAYCAPHARYVAVVVACYMDCLVTHCLCADLAFCAPHASYVAAIPQWTLARG